MLRSLLAGAVALSASMNVVAQESSPRVWLDLDNGPIILELDAVNAPITTDNFLNLVEQNHYDGLIFHRVVEDFVIQSGSFDEQGQAREAGTDPIQSERNNGLSNTNGTIAMALRGASGGGNDLESAQAAFFINTTDNSQSLDEDFTVFGEVVVGMDTVNAINDGARFQGGSFPIKARTILRAARVAEGAFPVMPLHTGSWFVPATSGTGFNIEVANDASNDQGPLLLAYWYDFRDGEQQWLVGLAPFEYGASEVTLEMRTYEGEGGDFQQPPEQDARESWGTLTVSFSDCQNGVFRYESEAEGSGELNVTRLTVPDQKSCSGL